MDQVMQYCLEELKMPKPIATMIINTLSEQPDIFEEFKKWLETRSYDMDDAISVEGYTAKAISEIAPFFDGIGVYGFLVELREDPEHAKKKIKQGFPRK